MRTSEIWRQEVQKAGFPDLYLCWVESWGPPPGGQGPKAFGLDASVGFMPVNGEQVHAPLETLRGHRVFDYQSAAEAAIELLDSPWKRFPSVMVGWDNTARRARAATIYQGATPAHYEHWLRVTAESLADVRPEENYLFILAWNEWAEGNHLEPDQRYGRAFLEATRSVLLDEPRFHVEHPPLGPRTVSDERLRTGRHPTRPARPSPPSTRWWPMSSVCSPSSSCPLADRWSTWGPGRAASEQSALRSRGIDVVPGTFTDVASLKATLDGIDDVGAVLLVDVLQHLADPQELLTALAAWALDHGSPSLVLTVPHVAHVDMGLKLLCGHFEVQQSRPLRSGEPPVLHRGDAATPGRPIGVGRGGAGTTSIPSTPRSTKRGLRTGLPEEMMGALQATAQAVNPNWSVTHFVWALEPRPDRHGAQLVWRGGGARRARRRPRPLAPRPRRRWPPIWLLSGSW